MNENGSKRPRKIVHLTTGEDDGNMENRSDNKLQNSQAEEGKKHRKESLLYILPLIIVGIAVVVALYTHFVSLKIEHDDVHKLQEFTERLSKRLYIVESSLQDNQHITARLDDPGTLVENMQLKTGVKISESDLSVQINTNNEELKALKDEVQKLKDEAAVKVSEIKDMQREHKEFETNMMTLEEKLGKQSQFVEKENAKVSKQISEQNEILRGLNLSVENLGSTQSSLNMSVENRVRISERDLSGQINMNNEELKALKDEVQKLKEEAAVKVSDIKDMQREHKELETNVMILEEKLGEQSQFVEKENAEVSKQISEQNEILRGLNLSVENLGSAQSSLNMSVENRVRISERNLSGQIGKNNEELKALKDEVQKLKDEAAVNVGDIKDMQREHNEFLTNVMTLEEKLGEHSQFVEKRNAEVSKQISEQNEILRGLNLSVENLGSTQSSLNMSVENRVRISERDLSGQINMNNEELKALKDEVQKLKEEAAVKVSEIKDMQREHKELETNVMILEEKLGEQSQFVEKENAEVSKQISEQNEILRGLNLSVENLVSTQSSLNMSVENRVRISERDLSGQIYTNNEELKALKDEVQKLKEVAAVKVSKIKDMQREHKELETNVMILEEKLGEQSQFVEKENAEVSKQISEQNEILRGLNLSVENLGSAQSSLNMSVENRVRISERNLSGQIGKNNEELKALKDEVQKLKDEAAVNVGDIKDMQREHNEFLTNVMILEEKLGEHSQFVEKRNAEVSKQMSQYNETLRGLNVTVQILFGRTPDGLNVSLDNFGSTPVSLNRIRISERDLSGQINYNNEELKVLKDEVQKLKDEVAVQFGDIKDMQREHKELQTHVMTLEQIFAEKKNAEIVKQMSQHNETLNALNVSVENLGSALSSLNASLENRIKATEHDLLGQIYANNKETEALKYEVQKLNAELLANVTTLGEKLGEQSQFAEKTNAEVVKQMSQHNETLNSLSVSVENLGSALSSLNMSVENRIQATKHDLLGQINVNNKEIEALKDEAQKLNANFQTNVTTLEEKLREQTQFAGEQNAEVVKQMSQHNETLNGLKVSVENVGITVSELSVYVVNLDSTLSSLNVSVYSLRGDVKHLAKNMTGLSNETLGLDKRTEDIEENIFDKGSLTIVIMINTTLLVLVIIYLAANRYTNRHISGNLPSYSTAGRILSQVRANPALKRKLCVISFYEETHPVHMHITRSVTQELNMELLEFIIRRHENILEFPLVSLYFLFVDFNDRNVILEDPTLGLGDLRLTTVQAIQKMGGKIVIFYVRDPNSRHLDPMQLYNENLASVTRQLELSDLNRLSRFISVYDQLTDYQKAHLRHIVVHELNGR